MYVVSLIRLQPMVLTLTTGNSTDVQFNSIVRGKHRITVIPCLHLTWF